MQSYKITFRGDQVKKIMTAAVAAMLLGTNCAAYAAAPKVTANVPLRHEAYQYIEKLSGMGYLRTLPTGAKPYSRLDMAKWVMEARKAAETKPMPSYLAQAVDELEKYLEAELAELQGRGSAEDFKLREAGLEFAYADNDSSLYSYNSPRHRVPADWQPLNHRNNGYRYGEEGNFILTGEFAGRIGHDTVLALSPRFSYDGDEDGKARLTEGYIKTRVGALGVEIGKQPLFWGQGGTGSLLLGNEAEPRTMLKLNFLEPQKIGGFLKFLGTSNINVFYTELEGSRSSMAIANGDYNDYDNAGLLGIRSDFSPTENFTFGVARVSMLGGDGNALSRSNWGDWLIGENATSLVGDRWNDIAGFDFRYRFPGVQVYGELYGEDQAGYLPSQNAERIGLYFPQLSKDGAWELRTEYARTTNVWYDHSAFQNGWSYRGGLLGDAMGADARKLYVGIGRYLGDGGRLGLNLMRTDMERSLPSSQQVDEVWLSYNRKLDDTVYLDAMLGLAQLDNAGFKAGASDDSLFTAVSVRWTY